MFPVFHTVVPACHGPVLLYFCVRLRTPIDRPFAPSCDDTCTGRLAPQVGPHPQRHRTSSRHLGRPESHRPRAPPYRPNPRSPPPTIPSPIRPSLPVNAHAALEELRSPAATAIDRRPAVRPLLNACLRYDPPANPLIFLRIAPDRWQRSDARVSDAPCSRLAFIASVETKPHYGRGRMPKEAWQVLRIRSSAVRLCHLNFPGDGSSHAKCRGSASQPEP